MKDKYRLLSKIEVDLFCVLHFNLWRGLISYESETFNFEGPLVKVGMDSINQLLFFLKIS